MKKILVTGGAGFLGSHLCEKLLGLGSRVIAIDNLKSGHTGNFSSFAMHPHFQWEERDVTSPLNYEVDEIYNFACPASPLSYQSDPIETLKTNFLGALHVLNLAKERSIKVFQSSTSEVYGDPEVHPQPETYWGHVNPIGIRSCYDEGKRVAETLFFDYHRSYLVPIKVARIFNTYGPRMQPSDGRVVSNFILQALQNQPITIYGKGSQTRSFCFVDDLIEGCIRLMQSPQSHIGPFNLGNPDEHTILELAELCIKLIGSSSKLVFKPLPQDDPRKRKPDISEARKCFDWAPKTSLKEGLLKTIPYFETTLD